MKAYSEDYDVVIDTLQNKYDILWKLTETNSNMDMTTIMDDIRLKQMDELTQAINLWLSRK
jgi:hypothetical protein